MVHQKRRVSFLAAYGATILAVLLLWIVAPLAALIGFLGLSAIHFATDGRAGDHKAGDWALGILLVAGPAVLHRPVLARLFGSVLHHEPAAAGLALVLQAIALIALVPVVRGLFRGGRMLQSTPPQVATGLVAVLVLPPFVGFACGFVLLHARGQTRERQAELGCVDLASYLARIAPVMLGAFAVLAGLVWLLARAAFDDTAMLFACIAALAVPHMLVTPLWCRDASWRPLAAR